ncbi:hypothetical protein SETIT_4G076100v2 [Setaria italica]|uniref:Uncharacterized protein n=1 Tax=Setaria italica TaxID=4555 RepID=A0A368QTT2_SETIT|nr:hypothetical protein SETIT_4G076100v2 [Setaria italica]
MAIRQWQPGSPASPSAPQDRLLPTAMVNAASAAGFADLIAAIMALEIFFFLEPQSTGAGTAPSEQAPLIDSAVELCLPLAAAGTLLTAVAFVYNHLNCHAAVPAAGAANRRVSGVAFFILCVSAGVLDLFFYVQPPAGSVDHGARARALGLGALRALPAAATATFFWGMMLIIIAHVRAGGEGGGGAGAGAGHGAIKMAVRILTMIAVGAAAGLAFLVIMALCVK